MGIAAVVLAGIEPFDAVVVDEPKLGSSSYSTRVVVVNPSALTLA